MVNKTARADVTPVRQRTQYSCMSTSMMMCLQANGIECDEDEVNRVMGAKPMQGASWEDAAACAQHYGMRVHLVIPCMVSQLKEWTDRGVPVMIAWNPEDRDWSHASVVFDVEEQPQGGSYVIHVADPNIPNPSQVVRVVTEDEFYRKWAEKWPKYLVRRPAMAIEREITPDGRQVLASIEREAMGSSKKASKLDPPYSGNPDGKPIYKHTVEHGYDQPLSGGWDIMKRLQDRLRIEQGRQPREPNPRLASDREILAAVENELMDRAAQLLWYMDEREAALHLVKEGISRNDAFLAVKAGKILNKRREKGRGYRASNDAWQNLIEVPQPPPTEPGVPGLLPPCRLLGQADPQEAGTFWWLDKEPAEVWRNHYYRDRFVMTPNEGGHFILVPPDQVGVWGGKGYQVVSQPQNPRL